MLARDSSDFDKLYKVRPLLDYFNNKFKELYEPNKEVSIGEQLLLHKGRLAFKQYNTSKRARFGIKIFSLCEDSGYLLYSKIHTGK